MPTIRLFGNDIKVAEKEEEEKSIMLFGKRIFPYAELNKNNNQQQQHYNRLINIVTYLPPPDLPPNMCSAQRSEPVYIGWKCLEDSDVNKNLSRFLIPIQCCTKLLHYMSTPEKEQIENQDHTGLDVSVMDPMGHLHAMKFSRWKSLRRLVFNRGWNKLVTDNQLQKGDIVRLWHYRTLYNNKPCFAMSIIKS